MPTIDEQVEILMSGTEYGDPQIRENMKRDLRERLLESEKPGDRCVSTAATTRARLICIWDIPSPCGSCASSRTSVMM